MGEGQEVGRIGPQWSPGLMAGGRRGEITKNPTSDMPQWSPGLMAGGSPRLCVGRSARQRAAMEPRPDGRGKSPSVRWSLGPAACRNGAPA